MECVTIRPVTCRALLTCVLSLAAYAPRLLGAEETVPGWTLSGTASQCYEAGLDPSVHHGGAQSAKLFFKIPNCAGFGLLMQTIRADEYRGRRVRLTGWIKTADAGRANLVLRIDSSAGETYAMDSMMKRATHGQRTGTSRPSCSTYQKRRRPWLWGSCLG